MAGKKGKAAEKNTSEPPNKTRKIASKTSKKVPVSTRRTLRPRKPPPTKKAKAASKRAKKNDVAPTLDLAEAEEGNEEQVDEEANPMMPVDFLLDAIDNRLAEDEMVEAVPGNGTLAATMPEYYQQQLLFSHAVVTAHKLAFQMTEVPLPDHGDQNPLVGLIRQAAEIYGLQIPRVETVQGQHDGNALDVKEEIVEEEAEGSYWALFAPENDDETAMINPARVQQSTDKPIILPDTNVLNTAKSVSMKPIPDMQDSCDSIKKGANAENGQSLPADASNEVFEGQRSVNGTICFEREARFGTDPSNRKVTDDYVENATEDVMKPSKLLGFDSECSLNAKETRAVVGGIGQSVETGIFLQSIETHGKSQKKVLETVKGGQVDSVNNGGYMQMKGINTLDVATDDRVETAVGLKGGHQQTVAIAPIAPTVSVDVALTDSEVQASSRSLAGAKIVSGTSCAVESENRDFVLIAAHKEPTPTIADLMNTMGKLGFSSEPMNICGFKSFALSTGTNRIVGYKFQASMQLASELNELLDDQQFPQKMDMKNRFAFGDQVKEQRALLKTFDRLQTRNHCFIGSQLSDDSIAHCCFYKIICRDLFIANTILIDRKGLTLQKGGAWESLGFGQIIEQFKDKAQAAFQELNKPSKHRVQKSLLEHGFPRNYLSISRSAP